MSEKENTAKTQNNEPEIVPANPGHIPVCNKAFDQESSRIEDLDEPCFNGEA